MASPVIADILSALNDNADYAETQSASKCRTFITACTRYMLFAPAAQASGGASAQLSHASILSARSAAEAWLELHSTDTLDAGPRVTKASFTSFRT